MPKHVVINKNFVVTDGSYFPCYCAEFTAPSLLHRFYCTEFIIPGLLYRVYCTEFTVPGLLYRVYCTGFTVPSLLYRVYCTEFTVPSLLYRVYCTGFTVPGLLYQALEEIIATEESDKPNQISCIYCRLSLKDAKKEQHRRASTDCVHIGPLRASNLKAISCKLGNNMEL